MRIVHLPQVSGATTTTMRIVHLPQVSGAIRLLALTAADSDAVSGDRAMIDAITPLGCVDVFRDGRKEWGAVPRHCA